MYYGKRKSVYLWFNVSVDNTSEIYKKFNIDKKFNVGIEILLKDNGYGGGVFKHWDKGNMYSCFYSNQIKII